MTELVTSRELKWSFAKFIFSILMFFFTLALVSTSGSYPGMRYYLLVTSCLCFICTATFYGSEFIGNLANYKQQKSRK
ncbi:Uncharacterised protein [Shigella sonnei]|jgi:hypothetical protein|nr:Uncharacterised protein [Shigella sonnei]